MEDSAMQMREMIRLDQPGFRQRFLAYDRNNTTQCSHADFAKFLAEYGIRLDEWNFGRLMDRVDQNNKGVIDYKNALDFFRNADFMDDAQVADIVSHQGIACHQVGTPTPPPARPLSAGNNMADLTMPQIEERLRRKIQEAYGTIQVAFRAADVDHSGHIGYGELKKILDRFCFKLTEKAFQSLARRLDTDSDGLISHKEFIDYFNSVPSRGSSRAFSEKAAPLHKSSKSRSKVPAWRRAAITSSHPAASEVLAHEELRQRFHKNMPSVAKSMLQACTFADKARSGYVHRAELKVAIEAHLFEIKAGDYLRLVKQFEGGTNKVDYKKFISFFTSRR